MYKDQDGVIEDSFQAFLVDGANFTKEEEYPIQEEWMVPNYPPVKVMPFFKAFIFIHPMVRLKGSEEIQRNI